jgi:ubiquitin C-terminal hydrolase
LPPGTNADNIGFSSIGILGTPDSVVAAMRRKFTPAEIGNLNCNACNLLQPVTESIRIEGSPEYLRIKLSIVNGNGGRNNNPVVLNEYLDLAQYQAIVGDLPLLKYRLSSVLSHWGLGLDFGHWVASARGPDHVFYINDATVTLQKPPSRLSANPQMESQAVVLMYKRVHTR